MVEQPIIEELKEKIRQRIAMAEEQLVHGGAKAEETFKIMCNEKIFELNWVLQTLADLEQSKES